MDKRERIDLLLVEKGFFETREQAKRAVMAGLVFNGEKRIDKPGMKIDSESVITVKGSKMKYVGRGGLKLQRAIEYFKLNLEGMTAIDIGASTGGFTDCMLQNGANKVYAVDVGYNQLAWKLRQDERVVVMERLNFRYANPEDFEEDKPAFATIDVSFISLRNILPKLTEIIEKEGFVVALVKPQFEAGREEVGKKGIVREAKTHIRVLLEMVDFSRQLGYSICGLTYSPITGGDGNIEFLLLLQWTGTGEVLESLNPEQVVAEAHEQLKKT